MSRVAIVTDSGAALAPETRALLESRGGFAVVDMPVTISGTDLTDSSTIHEAIVVAHALGEQVQTSSPSPGAFEETYRTLAQEGYKAIVSIHLATELSATTDSARIAAEQVDTPVLVIDSRTVAMAYGFAAIYAHQLAQRGHSAKEIASAALEICENSEIYFMIPTLDAIRRSGRVHPALARVGQLLQIRPVGTVIDGKLTYLDRPRTLEAARTSFLRLTLEEITRRTGYSSEMEHPLTPHPSGKILAIQYCGKKQDAQQVLTQLEQTSETEITPLPPVLAAHTGVGALVSVIY